MVNIGETSEKDLQLIVGGLQDSILVIVTNIAGAQNKALTLRSTILKLNKINEYLIKLDELIDEQENEAKRISQNMIEKKEAEQ